MLEDMEKRLSELEEGSPEHEAFRKQYRTKCREFDEVRIAKRCRSPESFFQRRLSTQKIIHTLAGEIDMKSAIVCRLVGIRLLGEQISEKRGILLYKITDMDETRQIQFRKESDTWRVCGIRDLYEFQSNKLPE